MQSVVQRLKAYTSTQLAQKTDFSSGTVATSEEGAEDETDPDAKDRFNSLVHAMIKNTDANGNLDDKQMLAILRNSSKEINEQLTLADAAKWMRPELMETLLNLQKEIAAIAMEPVLHYLKMRLIAKQMKRQHPNNFKLDDDLPKKSTLLWIRLASMFGHPGIEERWTELNQQRDFSEQVKDWTDLMEAGIAVEFFEEQIKESGVNCKKAISALQMVRGETAHKLLAMAEAMLEDANKNLLEGDTLELPVGMQERFRTELGLEQPQPQLLLHIASVELNLDNMLSLATSRAFVRICNDFRDNWPTESRFPEVALRLTKVIERLQVAL